MKILRNSRMTKASRKFALASTEIRIGIKEFKCAGVSPPLDHPHIYLEMGTGDTIVCPYCVTLFRYDPRLGPSEADPPDCVFLDPSDA